VAHVDDLIEGRKQQVFLAIIPRFAHRLPQCRWPAVRESRITRKQNPKTQESAAQYPAFLQNRILYPDNFCLSLRPICILHGRLLGGFVV